MAVSAETVALAVVDSKKIDGVLFKQHSVLMCLLNADKNSDRIDV